MPPVAGEQGDGVDHRDPVDPLGVALCPCEGEPTPVVHAEPHPFDVEVVEEGIEPVAVPGDVVGVVAALGRPSEAGQVGGDSACHLEEREPVVG